MTVLPMEYLLSNDRAGYRGRWVIVNYVDIHMGWSGARWVPFGGDTEISSFDTIDEADTYARAAGMSFHVAGKVHSQQLEIIQDFPDELDYVNAQLHPASKCGHFLEHFFQACLRADAENYPRLRPLLKEFMAKYPASPERLAMERREGKQ